jgi:hypothetical protein
MIRRFLFIVLMIQMGMYTHAQSQKLHQKDIKDLYQKMEGSFSSEAQSKEDSAFFHIKLRMRRIWNTDKNGYWLYVEQSVANAQEKPYRQRVYHVYQQDDTTAVSKVYEIQHPMQYAGGWKDLAKLASLTKDSLIDRQGCGIYLHKQKNGTYTGSTPGKECLSSLRGATYATSEVTIYDDKLVSWDRGWSKDDKQVWGAVKGGYIFIKQKKEW